MRAARTRCKSETRVVGSKPGVAPTEGLLAVGVQLQGRYKILGVIGVGGMGAVYRAQDLRFLGVTRLCAIKEMVNTATDPRVREMITRNLSARPVSWRRSAIPRYPRSMTTSPKAHAAIWYSSSSKARTEARVSEAEAARRRASGGVGYPGCAKCCRICTIASQGRSSSAISSHRILCSMPMGVSARGLRHRQDLPERRKGHDDRDGGLLTPSSIA